MSGQLISYQVGSLFCRPALCWGWSQLGYCRLKLLPNCSRGAPAVSSLQSTATCSSPTAGHTNQQPVTLSAKVRLQ